MTAQRINCLASGPPLCQGEAEGGGARSGRKVVIGALLLHCFIVPDRGSVKVRSKVARLRG